MKHKILFVLLVIISAGCTVVPPKNNQSDTTTENQPANQQPEVQHPATMTEAEALVIAETSCIKGDEALNKGTYNAVTQTWWFDANLNATRPGCNPACVVSEVTKTAEINWRCTGLLEPGTKTPTSTAEFTCSPESREAEFCTMQYAPVCATVQIQCIKAPCDPIQQTFGNACQACQNKLVTKYTNGACAAETN